MCRPSRWSCSGGRGLRGWARGAPQGAWRYRRAIELVELLALPPRHRLHRERAIETLWPTLTPEAGSAKLGTYVFLVAPRPPARVREGDW